MSNLNCPTVIIAAKAGRLGNRLFQSAHFMGNALARGYRLLNPSLGEYARLYEGSAGDPLCGFPRAWRNEDREFADHCREFLYAAIHLLALASVPGIVPGVKGIDIRRFDEAEEGAIELNQGLFSDAINSGKLVLTMGWKFSDHEGMRRYREEIARYFTPILSVRKPAEEVIARARKMGDLLIGVHVRQDDYRRWKNGIHFYETERYAQWMREMLEGNPGKNPVFLICASNSVDDSLFAGLPVIKGPGFPAGDLHALSLCDRIIGPPSTFSSWASYHGDVPICVLHDGSSTVREEDFVRMF